MQYTHLCEQMVICNVEKYAALPESGGPVSQCEELQGSYAMGWLFGRRNMALSEA